MATYRRTYRPTMEHRRGPTRQRENGGGTPNPADPAIAAALGKPVPGMTAWRKSHGRKSAMLYCEALKLWRSFQRQTTGIDRRMLDFTRLEVYPCEEGTLPGTPGPRHWHTGHSRGAA